MEEEQKNKPRKPDFKGAVKIALWINGTTASLHIGDLKLRLEANEEAMKNV